MPTEQFDLFVLPKKSIDTPFVPAGDVEALISVLEDAMRRMTAEEICSRIRTKGWDKRRVRAAAEASHGLVLSAPGLPGYRLAKNTPVHSYYEQERRCYKSQIRRMEQRLVDMDRAIHGVSKP